MSDVTRYDLRIVDHYAADGSGERETDARMAESKDGKFVRFDDYENLKVERDAMERRARAARPAQTEQPPIAVQVCKLGIYGKAYDAPETKRAYTYAEQPDNVGAMKLGRAVRAASSASSGDEIDRGLALLHALAAEGFGVFAVGAEYSAEG